jgi:hypothetical protein
MAEMGNYCKAYHASGFRKFRGWTEDTSNLRGEKKYVEGKEVFEPKTSLEDDDILYLQENYVVTHGIFKDEHIVFDKVTDQWKEFCHGELAFQIPDYAKPDVEAEPKEKATAREEVAVSAPKAESKGGKRKKSK